MKNFKYIIPFVFCMIVLGYALNVFAAPCPAGQICNPLFTDDFAELAKRIGKFLLDIGAILAVLMVVVGGLQIMTAGGKSEQVTTGRKTIMWALIGLVVLLVAQGLVSLIKDILGVT